MNSNADNTYYYLSLQCNGVVCSIELNGVVIVEDKSGNGINADIPVNSWIMPSDNVLTMNVYSEVSDDNHLETKLFIHDNESMRPTAKATLAESKYPVEPIGILPLSLPIPILDEKFEFIPDTKLWNEAEQIAELSEQDKTDILTLAENVRQAIANKDAEKAYGLLKYRFNDMATADFHTPEKIKEVAIKQYEWIFGEASEETFSEPLTIENSTFKIAANNKLVLLYGDSGRDAVVFTDPVNQDITAIDVFASKINGEWTVTRGL